MRLLVILGTRPEAIKLAPLILRLRREAGLSLQVCSTGQHRDLLMEPLRLFDITPDFDLGVMQADQSLSALSAKILAGLDPVLRYGDFDRVIVQGDTTSAMCGALAAAHRAMPVAHIEAGLRSGNAASPWPEEINRQLIARIADLHFAPTPGAATNLRAEGIPQTSIHMTGNTGIDALLAAKSRLARIGDFEDGFRPPAGKKFILVTMHRRDNLGRGLAELCWALRGLGEAGHQILFPAHPNPSVRNQAQSILARSPGVRIIEPQSYLRFVALMDQSDLIITDSGGVQEEATALGKPTLVVRDTTERPEAIAAGAAQLVCADRHAIAARAKQLLANPPRLRPTDAFGDGRASERIVRILLQGAQEKLAQVA
ncbi:MAG TPA: UDP-N-acetylglucosamine 2-epimerase (non-hydrolyzing) [Paracoccaceae bacterium]|nr:UDP-N-acetylglucosamine 2-epimerase (non-hydrolyzing) [Paracoccaceae bacterium]